MKDRKQEGVVVTHKEIYKAVQSIQKCLNTIEPTMSRLEDKTDKWEVKFQLMQEEMMKNKEIAEKALEKSKQLEENRTWFYRMIGRAFFAALITGLIGGAMGVFFLN
ncbi:hypothetical protein [Evansella halocellulosilytica]|uniref:hypothetical protein n=1 Tax=Evansella halocellulosilytica TaxID=2011013 RepID=UPI000BB67CF0|nr:hypothetical protein [Evansella halocellulosilytica]